MSTVERGPMGIFEGYGEDDIPPSDDAREVEVTLLPCPFCGGEARIEPWIDAKGDMDAGNMISCSNETCAIAPCLAEDDRATAIAAWNTRLSAKPADPAMGKVERAFRAAWSDGLSEGMMEGMPGHIGHSLDEAWDKYAGLRQPAEYLGAAEMTVAPDPLADKLRVAREALEPFVAKLDGAITSFAAAEEALGGPMTDEDAVTITIGALRRARAALEQIGGDGLPNT